MKNHTLLMTLTCCLIACLPLSAETTEVEKRKPQEYFKQQCCVCATPCKTTDFVQKDGILLPSPRFDRTLSGFPSPSCLRVWDIPKWAVVKGLKVTLHDVRYSDANALTVILVSPCGDAVVLLNQVGNFGTSIGSADESATFIFSDCDGTSLDCFETDDFVGVIKARPTDCNRGSYPFDNFSCHNISSKLSSTFCSRACGIWKLFVGINVQQLLTVSRNACSLSGNSKIRSWSLTIDYCIPCEKPKPCSCSDCTTCVRSEKAD